VLWFHGGRNDESAGCKESGPARSGFDYPASFYMDAYRSYQSAMAALLESPPANEIDRLKARSLLYEHRARARWALATRGVESIPFALEMLRSSEQDERDDARRLFNRMGEDEQVLGALIVALEKSEEPDEIESLTVALGATGNPKAAPSLVRVLRHPGIHDQTRSSAIKSLGRIAERRFDQADDPEGALNAWLQSSGHWSLVSYANADLRLDRTRVGGPLPAASSFTTPMEMTS